MNPSLVEIHEFSTGIRPEQTADGGWVSRGFTGQYMNRTIASIPFVVERSIANREFALTEGASRERPAIIGREVGTGDDAWSVVAVVTRGQDEFGRSGSFYRYFLCEREGNHNLWKILAWLESQGMPTFDPFDTKVVGQPNQYVYSHHSPNLLSAAQVLPSNTSDPILLPPGQQYDFHNINMLAIKKAKANGQPVSWAFNVEALEKPRRFQVIQPASDRAYQILQRVLANVPKVLTPVVADEEALKSAIRSLMNSSQVKQEAVQTIVEALGNDQIISEYWHTLFDAQGAKTAISQKIYSPQMVRLVTLRAMVIPETLPEFLWWLNIKGGKNKLDNNQRASLEIQFALSKKFPQQKLIDGIKLLLPKLLDKQITPETVSWLLTEKQSAWAYYCSQFLADVRADLDSIGKQCNFPKKTSAQVLETVNCENKIWRLLINNIQFIQRKDNPRLNYFEPLTELNYYKPLAELFNYIGDYYCDKKLANKDNDFSRESGKLSYFLAAYFYQVTYGEVPKKVFLSAFPDTQGYYIKSLGILLYRRTTFLEIICSLLTQRFIVPIQTVIPLLVFTFVGGLFMGKVFLGQPLSPTEKAKISEHREIFTNTENQYLTEEERTVSQKPLETLAPEMTEDEKEEALGLFPQTRDLIVNMVDDLKKELATPQDTIIIDALKSSLKDQTLDYNLAFRAKSPEQNFDQINAAQRKWVEAIYAYQKTKNPNNARGYINRDGPTYEDLKNDIKKNLGESSKDR